MRLIRRYKGFTLLEVLITLVFFALGVVTIAGLFVATLDNSLDAEKTSIAINLAQAKLEAVRNTSYDSIVSVPYAAVPGFTSFQRKVDASPSGFDGLLQVTVTVSFQYKGGTVEVPLVTYVSKN